MYVLLGILYLVRSLYQLSQFPPCILSTYDLHVLSLTPYTSSTLIIYTESY